MRNFEKKPSKIRFRKCKVCENKYEVDPYKPFIGWCSVDCGYKYQQILKSKKEKKELSTMREKIKGLPEFKKDLEKEINHIIRLIDKGCKCISCNAKGNSAGHYHSVGANGSLRYNLHNLHIQEYSCNGEKGANIVKYGQGLIEIYSKEYKEYIEYDLVSLYPTIKLSISEIKDAITKAKNVVKILKTEDKEYNPEERLQRRTFFNKIIGIYNK
jgi:hypothetical protein